MHGSLTATEPVFAPHRGGPLERCRELALRRGRQLPLACLPAIAGRAANAASVSSRATVRSSGQTFWEASHAYVIPLARAGPSAPCLAALDVDSRGGVPALTMLRTEPVAEPVRERRAGRQGRGQGVTPHVCAPRRRT